MANEIIDSFDFNADAALKAVQQLSTQINSLEKELAQLQKEGKDTTVVQQKLAAATSSLDKALKQETTTARGAAAQAKALNIATKDLEKSQDKADKSGKSFGASLGRNAVSFKSFAGGLARGGTALANLAGGLGLAGGALAVVNFAAEKAVEGFLNLFKESEAVTAAKERLFAATEQAVGSIVEETRASNGLFAELKDGNTTQERKREISAKLNELYPKIIGNTNLLTASEDQLKRIQAEVNAGIRTRILLQAREQQTAEIVAKIAQNEVKLRVEANKVTSQGVKATEGQINAIKARDAAELERLKKQGASEEELANLRSAFLQSYETGNIRIVDATSETGNALAAENKALLKELETLDEAYKDVDRVLSEINLGASNTAAAAKNTNENSKATKANAAEQKALEGSLAALRAEQSRLNKETEEATKIKDEERLKSLSAQYIEVTKSITAAEKKIKEYRGEIGALDGSLSALRVAQSEIRKQLDEQVTAKDVDKIQSLNAQFDQLTAQIEELENLTKTPVQILPETGVLEQDIEKSKLALSQLLAQQAAANIVLQQLENDALQSTANNAEEQAKVREKFAKQATESERAQRLAALAIQQEIAQKELAMTIEDYGELSSEAIKAKTDLLNIQKEIAQLQGQEFIVEIQVKTDEKKLKDKINEIADYAEQLSSVVIDFAKTQIDATLSQIEGAIGKQESLLDELLSNEQTISAERVKLEKERLEALNKEREKAKNKEAIIAQAQIAINLALAVARAVAEGGAFAAPITIAAAIGAAVIGFIQAKQTAQNAYFHGTTFLDDPRAARGRDTISIRANRGEGILPTDRNRRYKKAFEGIFYEKVSAPLANDFFANNAEWLKAMQQYKEGAISPNLQPFPVPFSTTAPRQKSQGEALPLASALRYIGQAISEQSKTVSRGGELRTVERLGSSNLDKMKNKSKGKNR